MTLEDIKNYFGNAYRFGKDTKMSPSTWTNWMERGYIPIASQMRLEHITKGALKANFKHVEHRDNE
jgi:hypothetical protein